MKVIEKLIPIKWDFSEGDDINNEMFFGGHSVYNSLTLKEYYGNINKISKSQFQISNK